MQSINLQICPNGIKPVINVSQNDIGRQFQLVLYDGTSAYSLPSGTTARIDGIKPDKKGFSYPDAVTVSGNVVTVTTKQQMTIVSGLVECEIRLSKNSNDIGTLNFKMMVEPSPVNDDTDISETDLPAIIELGRENMLNSEAWAKGTKDGVAVGSSEPQYHNNSKYHSEQASSSASTASTAAINAASSASTASTKASQASASATSAAASATEAAAWSAHPPYIGANGNWYVWNLSTSAYVDSGIDASITVQIADITMLATTATPYVTNTGTDTDPVFHLFIPKGAGIASVSKTGTSGLVDTYTITFTDGSTTTYTITNGADGNGIASITKTGTSGLVDTYTITYTNGTTSTFTVTNGQDGTGATLQTLADVDITNLANKDVLEYNSTSQKFENKALATVASSGAYNDLSGKPSLGTAAAKDSTNAVTQNSTDLVESGAVYTEVSALSTALTNVTTDIAPIEDGTNYSRSYTKGRQFIRGGLLYRITASSVNSSIAIDTGSGGNATIAGDVTSQITALDKNIGNLTYYEFQKSDMPSLSNIEAIEYFIDNNIPIGATRTYLLQEIGGYDYTCLVERVANASNATSAICISYNGDIVYLNKNQSSTWTETFINKGIKYFAGDVITFSNQLNGYNACIGSNDKSLRVFIPLDKPIDSAITSATLSLSYLELWGNGSDVAIHSYVGSSSVSFNNQGIVLNFTFGSDLTNYGTGFTALANLIAVIQGTITFA